MRREQRMTLWGRFEITISEPPRFMLDNGRGRVFIGWLYPTVTEDGKVRRIRGWLGVWTRNGFGTDSVSDAVWESRKTSLLVEAGMLVNPEWSVWN